MPKTYDEAETVEIIAKGILPTFHAELAEARIKYYFVSEASSKGGRPVLGKVRKCSGAIQYLLDYDFLIEVALDQWNGLEEGQRKALVDHLLEYCSGEADEETGEMKWTVREPDVREFSTILSRHGAWNEGLVGFIQVAHTIRIAERVEEVVDDISAENVMETN